MEVIGVINLMDKHTIIRLKLEGDSNREVVQKVGINRKTVAKYWNDYKKLQKNLDEGKVELASYKKK